MIRKPETISFWRGRLPHWEVTSGRYFVTIHLAGAIPPQGQERIHTLAAGPNHVVETVNSTLAIFNKATGALVSKQTLATLFSGLVQGNGQYDPSVLYDDQAGRFVVEAQVSDGPNLKAYVDIAVSNSSDPTQGFAEIHQIEVDEGGLYWSDNGKLGFNADAYVFTGNVYAGIAAVVVLATSNIGRAVPPMSPLTVVMSAYDDPTLREEAERCGARYLLKPFSSQAVLSSIGSVI